MAEPILGLDVGSSYIKAVQGRETGTGVEIDKVGSQRLDAGVVRDGAVIEEEMEALSDSLEELHRAGGFTTRDVVFGVSGDRVLTNDIIVPYMNEDDLDDSLRHQISEKALLSLDVDKSEIDRIILDDFIDKESGQRKLRLFIAGVPSEIVENIAISIENAGLKPVGVDLLALSSLRSLRVVNRMPGDNTLDAIVDVGADLTVITFHQGGIPRYIQTIANAAGNAVTKTINDYAVNSTLEDAEKAKKIGGTGAIAKAINGSAETVTRNIRAVVDFYFKKHPTLYLGTVTLIGGSATLQGLQEIIQQEFDSIPVVQGEYDNSFKMQNKGPLFTHAENGGTYFAAAGLITGTLV